MFSMISNVLGFFSFLGKLISAITGLAIYHAGKKAQQEADLKASHDEDVQAQHIDTTISSMSDDELNSLLRKPKH